MVPTIEPKLKAENLPEWDGSHDTAIDYFWDVGQVANLEGWLPQALGFWLPTRLKKGSQVHLWFSTLPTGRQAKMRQHYLVYLQFIKEKYLGKKWQLVMNLEFERQTFRQTGHEDETPQTFIGRRIKSVRMLANSDDGGPHEVFLIMRTAPIKWSTILVLENIDSTEELYDKVNEHDDSLVDAAKKDSRDSITLGNLASALKRLGFSQNSSASGSRPFRRANRTEVDEEAEPLAESTAVVEEGGDEDGPSSDEVALKQAYAILKKRQRPPPKGGYPFSKNDHVTTKMGKAPPSPCKVCGSANHWDRECPDWNVYIERQQRGVFVVVSNTASEEAELMYHSAYCVLLEARINDASFLKMAALSSGSEYDSDDELKPNPNTHSATGNIETDTRQTKLTDAEMVSKRASRSAYAVHIEEVEDESWLEEARMPKATKGILEDVREDEPEKKSEDLLSEARDSAPEVQQGTETKLAPPPPPSEVEPIRALKKRNPKPGDSALGVSVLSVRGRLGSMDEEEVDLRVDTCADITLVSEEYHQNMKSPPPLRQGHKMSLAQLTNEGTAIRGYVNLPVLMPTTTGEVIQSEAEAYVVRGMSVPILLGEDYQLSYELSISHNVEEGTKIRFGDSPWEVECTGVDSFPGRAQAHLVASNLTTYSRKTTKAKEHRRAKERRHRRKLRNGGAARMLRASEDCCIKAHQCKQLRVEGDFVDGRDWLVERSLLANAEDSFFSIPNVLITGRKPIVPVSNMSDRPRIIRKGEIEPYL
ncbi:hypothetical protein C8R47DRAFT_1224947 [Mycena vitilis]|nr:hypothetical protein C8R47DRAFT_1224947 [Mycena vitilis]